MLDDKYSTDITYHVEELFLVRNIEIKKYAVKIADILLCQYILQI